MANKVIQYRYYGKEYSESKNFPLGLSSQSFRNGSAFEATTPILQLGIQTLPGTKFYLNQGVDPIVIGSTGIYELDLQNKTEITHIRFDQDLFDIIDGDNENLNAYLIVDIVYEQMEVE